MQQEIIIGMMRDPNLIAFLKPIRSQFSREGVVDLIDVMGSVTDIQASSSTLTLRIDLPEGRYSGYFETHARAFDMSTAMIEMVRVPDGQRIPVGPWDLDHIRNVMAVPMMRTYVNGALKGGLWCDLPGPEGIAEGRLNADFGFETQEGINTLTLDIIDTDRERFDWSKIAHLKLRKDDRSVKPLLPIKNTHPRIFLGPDDIAPIGARWKNDPEFKDLLERIRSEDLVFLTDNSQGTLEIACLLYTLTKDAIIGARAKEEVLELAHAETWSGRPDPLLMGGENDRVIGHRLYHSALGWDYLQPLFDAHERSAILSKVEIYLRKIYDFTLLQRAYMGCPSIDPHSLGSWNGAAIACMAFYEDLSIARRALPLFHGLFCDSLRLFPDSGKAAWATYFPFHLIRYLAAAHTFAGRRPELSSSPFLDNLGSALLASFEVPNSQELQRGLKTREHRYLTAFLCKFNPTPGIDSIYRAFAEKERQATGKLDLGIFDLLYSPPSRGEVATFPDRPLYARDVGDLVAISRGEQVVAVSLSGGPKAGRKAVFSLMPHNREFAPSLGAFDVTIDGTPVLCNINMGLYGLNSALTNTMCFEEGGAVTNGQYLNGAVRPEQCASIRRCFIGDRYVYAHVVLTDALDPKLGVIQADRVFIFDRNSGAIIISDAFQGNRPIRFATHLHCSGSVKDLGDGQYRLTGGQADLIAGIKGGTKALSNDEKGEIFVQVLESPDPSQVRVEEPTWVPGYIYGLNNTGKEDISEGRYPRYQRWRLEPYGRVSRGKYLLGLSPRRDLVRYADHSILLARGGVVRLGYGSFTVESAEFECECLMWDEVSRTATAMGVRRFIDGESRVSFAAPVDLEYRMNTREGTAYGQGAVQLEEHCGFNFDAWVATGYESWKTHNRNRASFKKATLAMQKEVEVRA